MRDRDLVQIRRGSFRATYALHVVLWGMIALVLTAWAYFEATVPA